MLLHLVLLQGFPTGIAIEEHHGDIRTCNFKRRDIGRLSNNDQNTYMHLYPSIHIQFEMRVLSESHSMVVPIIGTLFQQPSKPINLVVPAEKGSKAAMVISYACTRLHMTVLPVWYKTKFGSQNLVAKIWPPNLVTGLGSIPELELELIPIPIPIPGIGIAKELNKRNWNWNWNW